MALLLTDTPLLEHHPEHDFDAFPTSEMACFHMSGYALSIQVPQADLACTTSRLTEGRLQVGQVTRPTCDSRSRAHILRPNPEMDLQTKVCPLNHKYASSPWCLNAFIVSSMSTHARIDRTTLPPTASRGLPQAAFIGQQRHAPSVKHALPRHNQPANDLAKSGLRRAGPAEHDRTKLKHVQLRDKFARNGELMRSRAPRGMGEAPSAHRWSNRCDCLPGPQNPHEHRELRR